MSLMEVLPVSTHIQHNPSLDVVSIIQVNHHQLCIVVVHWRLQLTLSRFLPLFSVVTTSATSTLCHFHDHLGQGQPASLSPASALSKFMSSLKSSQPAKQQSSKPEVSSCPLHHSPPSGFKRNIWLNIGANEHAVQSK